MIIETLDQPEVFEGVTELTTEEHKFVRDVAGTRFAFTRKKDAQNRVGLTNGMHRRGAPTLFKHYVVVE